jgi:hypothetical protein
MARAFRHDKDTVKGRLDPYEVELLRRLVGDVVTLVGAADTAPRNPVTDRLFPDPSPDPETAAAVRDLIHDDLREAKLAAARAMLASLPDDGKVTLDAETADQWLTALNDVRLALGTALGVTEDVYEKEPGDAEMQVYQWLSFLQETLVEALSAERFGTR